MYAGGEAGGEVVAGGGGWEDGRLEGQSLGGCWCGGVVCDCLDAPLHCREARWWQEVKWKVRWRREVAGGRMAGWEGSLWEAVGVVGLFVTASMHLCTALMTLEVRSRILAGDGRQRVLVRLVVVLRRESRVELAMGGEMGGEVEAGGEMG